MRKAPLLAIVALAVAGIGCANGIEPTSSAASSSAPSPTAASPAAVAAVGTPAPVFTLEDQTGKKVSLSDFAGKVVVLEWLNPECPYVQRHGNAKTMETLAEKYAAKNVVWLGVNSTSSATHDANAKWISQHSLSYPILDDHNGEVGRSYGAKTTPHMYVIDTTGKLVYAGGIDDDPGGSKGSGALNYVDKALDEVTSGKAVTVSQSKPYGCGVKYK